jgi:membrane-associated phospholipid phosphatase
VDIFGALRDPEHAGIRARVRSATPRTRLFAVLLAVYLALTVAVVLRSPVLRIDDWVADIAWRQDYPSWLDPVRFVVDFGQRRPVAQFIVPLLLLAAWRMRSSRPMVTLVVAFLALNLSVGVVKLATGRLGPRGNGVTDVFAGGDIYPSGHVSNAVVMYGLLAMFVPRRHRLKAAVAAGVLAVVIGLGTLYLKTHWVTDVAGGWLAGGLVLCSLPWLTPPAQRLVDRSFSRKRAAVSVVLGSINLYVTLPLEFVFGGWVDSAFGGWLVASLILAVLPWLTPPLERRIARAVAGRRERRDAGARAHVVVPPDDATPLAPTRTARDKHAAVG